MKSRKIWKRLLALTLTAAIVTTSLNTGTVAFAAEYPSGESGIEILSGEGASETQTEDGSQITDVTEDQSGQSTEVPEGSSGQSTAASEDNNSASDAEDTEVTEDPGQLPDAGSADTGDSTGPDQGQQSESAPAENEAQTKAAADTNLYQDGSICIYNEQQLRAIGNGAQVYEGDASADTFGTGAALTKEDGSALTYAADGTYTLMNDIPLTKGSAWTLPEGFAGAFKSDGGSSTTVYDSETDTIYLYHQYQLEVIATSENPDEEPVMTEDYDAAHFGMGQMIWPDGEDHANLTYSMDHNYVVSKYFTEETPELIAAQAVEGELSGREYVGQVIFTDEEDKQYILIGNKQQLEAIGKTDSEGNPIKVTEPVWEKTYTWEIVRYETILGVSVPVYDHVEELPNLIYPGDADSFMHLRIPSVESEEDINGKIFKELYKLQERPEEER